MLQVSGNNLQQVGNFK